MSNNCFLFYLIIGLVFNVCGQETQLLLKKELISPNCIAVSSVNGEYYLHYQKAGSEIQGYLHVIPEEIFKDSNAIKVYGLQNEFASAPSIEFDEYSWSQFPCDSFDARYSRFKNVELYRYHNYLKEVIDAPEKLKFTPFIVSTPVAIEEKKNEVIDTIDYSNIQISGGPIKVPSEGIIDGVVIYEQLCKCYQREHFTIAEKEQFDSVSIGYKTYRDSIVSPKIEPSLQPFYLSQFELTNKEYNEFKQWVIDSICLETAYWNCMNVELSSELLNCSKKTRKSLDLNQLKSNYDRFGLKCPDKSFSDFRNNPDYIPALSVLYYPQPQRYYKRRELNWELWNYRMNDSVMINIMPDSTKFKAISNLEHDFFTNMFHWHPAYFNYPIVNISYEQLQAFCNWKTNQIQGEYAKKGLKVSVEIPQIHEYELALKTIVPEAKYIIYDHSNEAYFVETRTFDFDHPISNWFKKTTAYHELESVSGLEQETFEYNQWLHANYFKGLSFINGNVSEYCSTPITLELLEMNGISIPEGDLNDYVLVLGSNYANDVKAKKGSNVNTIFYKTIQLKSEMNAKTGARIILHVTKL